MIETVNIHGSEHPTYEGVLAEAHENGLISLQVRLEQAPLKENGNTAICSATAKFETKDGTKIFTDVGDANETNVNSMIKKHIIRMASTRAKGRALRDALNIAKALKEEIGGSEDVEDLPF